MASRICIAIVDDYEVVVRGVAAMLSDFGDRVEVAETDTDGRLARGVDLSLLDSFGQAEAHSHDLDEVLENPKTGRVVMYTWRFQMDLVEDARRRGFAGYVSKGLTAGELVDAIERIHAGEFVVDDRGSHRVGNPQRAFPGGSEGLTEREAEVLALIAQGRSNTEISEALYLSPDGTKSRIRRTYRRLGLHNRRDAIRWALSHGFDADPPRT